MVLWGKNGLEGSLRVEWRNPFRAWNLWGRYLGQHRVYWHAGPLIISWRRHD